MSYLPFHHKYRPQTFADLVGQEAIATTLTNALRAQKIAPAYLFTGPRGTGKTSSARIFAKSLNCMASEVPTAQPCGQCPACQSITLGNALDVIEIDAASNTGVDNIREIIDRAQYAPVQCRYKVYTIDECHMLSTAAFNSLLKTLEEPPPHVVFILATTDPQRVLPTIISRCQKFDYRRIPLASMVQHLTFIAQQEQMVITAGAVHLVAQLAQGGLRDAESLLDQLSLMSTEVTIERVWDLVGAVPEQDLLAIVQSLYHEQLEDLLDRCRQLMERGKEPLMILQNLASFYRDLSIAKTIPHRQDLTSLTTEIWPVVCELAAQISLAAILAGQQHLKSSEHQLKGSTQPRLWLEVTLLGLLPGAIQPIAAILSPPAPAKPLSQSSPPPQPVSVPSQIETVPVQTIDLEDTWKQVLAQLLPSGKGLFSPHGRLIDLVGDLATVGMKSSTFMKIAEGQKHHLQKALTQILGRPITVLLQLGHASSGTQAETSPGTPSVLSSAVTPTPSRTATIPVHEVLEAVEKEPILDEPETIPTPSLDRVSPSETCSKPYLSPAPTVDAPTKMIVSEEPTPFEPETELPLPLIKGNGNGHSIASQPSIALDSLLPKTADLEIPQFIDLDLDAAAARLAKQFGGEIVADYVTIWDL